MKSDYAAHLSLVHDAQDEQLKLKARNMKTIKEEIIFVIACAAIAVYTLIHFA